MRIIKDVEQGSMDWLKLRCGKITMSNAKALLTGGRGRTRESYILDVVSERLSGEPIEGYASADMERGNFLEPMALEAFGKMTGLTPERVGFIMHSDERIGCSPDALLVNDYGVEIKCPRPRQHIRNAFAKGLDDYRDQAQGCMWITGCDVWYVVSFCPWVTQQPIYIKRINRDRSRQQQLAESAIDAADTVDEIVAKAIDQAPPSELVRFAIAARDSWENVLGNDGEVTL